MAFSDPRLGNTSITFTISGKDVQAVCNFEGDENNSESLTVLHIWTFHVVRGYVDTIAFTQGVGATLDLSHFCGSDKVVKCFVSRYTDLAALCKFTPEELVTLLEKERPTHKHIHDLIDPINDPMEGFFTCAPGGGRFTSAFGAG